MYNAGRVGLAVAAFATGDLSWLSAATEDRLHEPYRAAAFPALPRLVRAARSGGALGACLSGAALNVIAFARRADAPAIEVALPRRPRRCASPGRRARSPFARFARGWRAGRGTDRMMADVVRSLAALAVMVLLGAGCDLPSRQPIDGPGRGVTPVAVPPEECLPSDCFATEATVKGHVVDLAGHAVAGLAIDWSTLNVSGSVSSVGSVADTTYVANVPSGRVRLTFRAPGFQPATRAVTLVTGKTIQLDITLVPGP